MNRKNIFSLLTILLFSVAMLSACSTSNKRYKAKPCKCSSFSSIDQNEEKENQNIYANPTAGDSQEVYSQP